MSGENEYEDGAVDQQHQGTEMVVAAAPQFPMAGGPSPGSTTGLSELHLEAKVIEILREPPDPATEIEIRPDGIPFVPTGVFRERMNRAFGPGQWAMRQESAPRYDAETQECVYDGSLWVRGQFVARAMGGCKWRPGNPQMTKSDAIEGAKSDCLKRCCKDLGVASELWGPDYIRNFIAEWAVPYQGRDYRGTIKVMWRKKGVPLSGQQMASATAVGGEFPLGFGPDTPVPDGPDAGKPLRSVSDAVVNNIASKASTAEWKLAAKAEIVRRIAEKAEAEKQPTTDEQANAPKLSDVLDEGEQNAE